MMVGRSYAPIIIHTCSTPCFLSLGLMYDASQGPACMMYFIILVCPSCVAVYSECSGVPWDEVNDWYLSLYKRKVNEDSSGQDAPRDQCLLWSCVLRPSHCVESEQMLVLACNVHQGISYDALAAWIPLFLYMIWTQLHEVLDEPQVPMMNRENFADSSFWCQDVSNPTRTSGELVSQARTRVFLAVDHRSTR